MSKKRPKFGGPDDDEQMRRVFVNFYQHTPVAQLVQESIKARRGEKLPAGRSTPNKATLKLNARFDKLVKAARPRQSVESVRLQHMPTMPKSTFARHWGAAKVRIKK